MPSAMIFYLRYVEKKNVKVETKNGGRELAKRLSGDIPVVIAHFYWPGRKACAKNKETEAWPAQWISHTRWESRTAEALKDLFYCFQHTTVLSLLFLSSSMLST